MRIVSVMRRRGQQQQPVGLGRQHLGETAALVFLADAMMRLIDDDQIPGDAFQLRQHAILLGEVDRGQT